MLIDAEPEVTCPAGVNMQQRLHQSDLLGEVALPQLIFLLILILISISNRCGACERVDDGLSP